MKRFRINNKAVSPVIATIIIVAVAIVMSIAVAYWVLGIGASMTRYEKLQFTSAYAPSDDLVQIAVKNTGSAPATLDKSAIFVNAVLLDSANVKLYNTTSGSPVEWTTSNTLTLQPGQSASGD